MTAVGGVAGVGSGMGGLPSDEVEVLERAAGRSGELVLRRNGADLEIIAGGTFLVSSANAVSSEALVGAALPFLKGRRAGVPRERMQALRVLIGGLGLGHALDVALAEPVVADVTVAEYEPAIVDWFRKYGERRAARLGAAEAAGRARIVIADVADVLRAAAGGAWATGAPAGGASMSGGGWGSSERAARDGPFAPGGPFDLVALDTDNGPDWLVREANAGLYDEAGVRLAHAALRPGGAVVFWSPERYEWFARRLAAVFADVHEVAAHDRIGRHCHEYTMYVALRGVD